MPTITGNGLYFNMADLFNNSNFLQSVGVSGSGSAFTTQFLSERWEFTGSFSNFSGVIPLDGTISTFRFYQNGTLAFTATNLGLPMPVLFGFMSQADLVGLHNWIFFYDDIINGGSAGENLLGYGGNDVINGGDGDDSITPGPGVDQVDGGSGLDLLYLDRSTSNLSFTLDTGLMGSNTGQTLADGSVIRNMERFNLITGSGNDTFNVTSVPDINGAWPMMVNGGAGYDTLIADFSSVVWMTDYLQWTNIESLRITGGSASESFTGGTGDDVINGGGGNDAINGNGGVDILDGGDGVDEIHLVFLGLTTDYQANLTGYNTANGATLANGTIIRNAESVGLATGSGNDTLTMGAYTGSVYFNAGSGFDTLIGDFSSATTTDVDFETESGHIDLDGHWLNFNDVERFVITGGTQADELLIKGTFYNADDILSGGGGNDVIDGGLGADILTGGTGNDTIYASGGGDTIDGGVDTDTLVVAHALGTGVTANLIDYAGIRGPTGATIWTGALVRNMENLRLVLSNQNDTIVAQTGLVGEYYINGNGGSDTFVGNFSDETRAIEAQTSGVSFAGTTTIFMQGGYRLLITGGSGDDALYGWSADDVLSGGDGVDVIVGGLGNDLVIGGDGDDRLYAFDLFANEGNPFATGEDILIGGAGADYLWGTAVFATASYEDSPDAVQINFTTFTAQGGHAQGDNFVSVEGLIGSAFNDSLTGNEQANVFSGGAGDDLLRGAGGNDILNGGRGIDTAGVSGLSTQASWHRNPDGTWTIASADGTDTLTSVEHLAFTDRNAFLDRAYSTFSGDGTSDVFMRHANGNLGVWFVGGSGVTGAAGLGGVDSAWAIEGVGDFNGDGRDDILMRHNNGNLGAWFMNGALPSGAAGLGGVSADWKIEGLGDLNGDGFDDLVWWNDNGALGVWFMNNGAVSGAAGLGSIDRASWNFEALADFNGDGKDDILWRNSAGELGMWFMDGGAATGAGVGNIAMTWAIEGAGDFNGDGRDDILMRDTAGNLGVWFMNGVSASGAGLGVVDHSFAVAAIGDYNGDGRDDILWWHDTGSLGVWFMNGAAATATSYGNVSHDWIINPGG